MSDIRLPFGDFDLASDQNRFMFFLRKFFEGNLNTAIPVVVTAVERTGSGGCAGYVSAKSLITRYTARHEAIPNVPIPKLPYFRYQHGTAAFICDPKVGDIGLAIFAQADVSNVNGDNTEKPPATFRRFDMSDGFYVGGFWGNTPTTFVKIEDSGSIDIKAPESLNIESPEIKVDCENLNIKAKKKVVIDCPDIQLKGAVTANQATIGGIEFNEHVHGGVNRGSDTTDVPE